MTENKGMTIASALKELKHIDAKAAKRIRRIGELSAGLSNMKPEFDTVDAQTEKVKSLVQSVEDLVQRKFELKQAVMRANLDTKVSWGGKDYTLQEVLLMKESGRGESGYSLLLSMLKALKVDHRVEAEAQRQSGEKQKVEVVRYFDVKQRDAKEDKLLDLMQNLDNLIEHANFTTMIDIEPLPAVADEGE